MAAKTVVVAVTMAVAVGMVAAAVALAAAVRMRNFWVALLCYKNYRCESIVCIQCRLKRFLCKRLRNYP